jgi:GTP-binding protein
MTMLDEAAVSFQVVLTKADKLKAEALAALAQSVAQALRRHPAAHPEMHVTSSEKRTGIEELRAEIQALAGA